jgi:hypothetical protein
MLDDEHLIWVSNDRVGRRMFICIPRPECSIIQLNVQSETLRPLDK